MKEMKRTILKAVMDDQYPVSKNRLTEKVVFLESILNTITEGIIYYDDDLNVVWANSVAAKESGATPEEMIGRNFFEAVCKMKDPCEGCPVAKSLSSEVPELIESNLFGSRLFVSRTHPVFCRDKKLPGRLFVSQDISNLRNRYSVTEILNLIFKFFHSPGSLSEICGEVLGSITQRFAYPAGYITLYDERTEKIVIGAEVDISGKLSSLVKKHTPSRCFSWKSLEEGKIINVTGLSNAQNFSGHVLKEAGVETILAVPLNVENDVTGAIILIDFKERLETSFMVDGLQAVGNRLGAEIQRKQTEEKLREERNFTNAVLNNAGPLIMVLDEDGRIVRFNKACEKLTGYSHKEVLGRFICDFLVDSRESDMINAMPLFTKDKGSLSYFEGSLITRDGQKRIMAWSNTVMEDTNPVHIVFIGVDITDRKKAEEEAELRRQQLLEADKLASLGILASGVAHEINNPNNFIMMNAPILRNTWKDILPILEKYYSQCGDFTVASLPYSEMRKEVPKLFDGIEDGSERIRKIIMNMKNYAKKSTPERTDSVNMNDVVTVAAELLSHEIKKSTQSFTIECSKNLPLVKGNRQRLEQVMVNLIQNACQSLPDRNKRIAVKTRYDERKKEIVISVADEGVGIRPEHRGRIFDSFFTTKAATGGTGLGLSLCASIVKEHDGRLEFATELEKGTNFYLSLPTIP